MGHIWLGFGDPCIKPTNMHTLFQVLMVKVFGYGNRGGEILKREMKVDLEMDPTSSMRPSCIAKTTRKMTGKKMYPDPSKSS